MDYSILNPNTCGRFWKRVPQGECEFLNAPPLCVIFRLGLSQTEEVNILLEMPNELTYLKFTLPCGRCFYEIQMELPNVAMTVALHLTILKISRIPPWHTPRCLSYFIHSTCCMAFLGNVSTLQKG